MSSCHHRSLFYAGFLSLFFFCVELSHIAHFHFCWLLLMLICVLGKFFLVLLFLLTYATLMTDVCWPRSPDGLCSLSFERSFYAQSNSRSLFCFKRAFYAQHSALGQQSEPLRLLSDQSSVGESWESRSGQQPVSISNLKTRVYSVHSMGFFNTENFLGGTSQKNILYD